MPNCKLRSITLSRPYDEARTLSDRPARPPGPGRSSESSLTVMMRQKSDPMVMAGPSFQVTQPESGG